MKKSETVEYILPSGWASALINADESGLSDEECVALGEWENAIKPGYCYAVSENSEFVGMHDAWSYYPYACDCAEYFFKKDIDTTELIGKRMQYKDNVTFCDHVLVVKESKINDKGEIVLGVVFEHVGLFVHWVLLEEVEEYVKKKVDRITMTIAVYGVKKDVLIHLKDIKSSSEEMRKWKEKSGISNRDLKKHHGEIRVNEKIVGQCMPNGKLKMNSTLF